MATYINGVIAETDQRSHSDVPNIDDYISMRRNTSGVKPCFVLLEMGLEIPDDMIHHPAIEELSILAIDMIALANVSSITHRVYCTERPTRTCSLSTGSNRAAKYTT